MSTPARVLAFDEAVAVAIEKSRETSRWSRRFTTGDVADRVDDASERTVRRAMNDAEGRGWIERTNYRKKWVPGDRAERLTGESD